MRFEVAIYPSRRGVANPYLRLLVEALMRTGECAGIEDFSFRFLFPRRGARKIIHLQWVPAISHSRFAKGLKGEFYWMRENARVFAALASVWLAKIFSRTKVIWTIHDAPVSDVHPTLMRILRAFHFWLADGYIIHAESARSDIPLRYRKKPCVMLPRPNVIGVYGSMPDRTACVRMRQYLGVPQDATVFLVFGFLRVYKNIERIIAAFQRAHAAYPKAYLVIAGDPYDAKTTHEVARLIAAVPHIVPILREIDDAYVARLIGASDYVVVGQERGYTSGVMFLAMSYKKPVIIRNWGAAPMHIQDGTNGFLFEWNDLPAVFGCAISIKKSSSAYRRMSEAAYRTMQPLTWDTFAHALVSFYRTLNRRAFARR